LLFCGKERMSESWVNQWVFELKLRIRVKVCCSCMRSVCGWVWCVLFNWLMAFGLRWDGGGGWFPSLSKSLCPSLTGHSKASRMVTPQVWVVDSLFETEVKSKDNKALAVADRNWITLMWIFTQNAGFKKMTQSSDANYSHEAQLTNKPSRPTDDEDTRKYL